MPPAFSLSLPICILLAAMAIASGENPVHDPGSRADEPMVDLAKAVPGIVIELRYASTRNLTGHSIYGPHARCLVRKSVAERLRRAQALLQPHRCKLKVWDAYRPRWAQEILWKNAPVPTFVGDPGNGGSLHTFGCAVDVTIVNHRGQELRMPTDFDDFSPAAAMHYTGGNLRIAANLKLLQEVMIKAGFIPTTNEWWHFVAQDFSAFGSVDVSIDPPA